MTLASVNTAAPTGHSFHARFWRRFTEFLFSPDTGEWLGILRVGLGIEIVLYSLSLRADWTRMFARSSTGFLNREFNEAILAIQNPLVPRLGWFVWLGEQFGLREQITLNVVWLCLFFAGCFMIAGLFSRPGAVLAWLFHLSVTKSGEYLAYGMDNFLTIGLFYLVIGPLPDRWALDRRLWKTLAPSSQTVGFFRRVLQLHVCVIYFFSGVTKCLGAGWWTGDSMWRALTRPPFDLISSRVWIHWKPALLVVGVGVCLLEITFPVFIWLRRTRPFFLFGIVAVHIGIGLAMGLQLFSLVMIVLNLAAFGPDCFRQASSAQSSDCVLLKPATI